jgi:hypothetical protein
LNLLDLVPALRRQIKQYIKSSDTDSVLAGYLADAIDALNWRWIRQYQIDFTPPSSYSVSTDITARDKRPIILMASIIYKMGTVSIASFRDGDFAYDPVKLRLDPITHDLAELNDLLPSYPILAAGFTSPLRGYSNVWNPESYNFLKSLLLYF